MKMKKIVYKTLIVALSLAGMLPMTSCEKGKSYSELLKEEEHAVNWYLAQNDVVMHAPEDSVFITGEKAPFYRMDMDGNVYMRVVTEGNRDNRPKEGDRVYFSFVRKDIKAMYAGDEVQWVGNSENLGSAGGTSFIFGNTYLPSSTQYGTGIQLPMKWIGLYSEVEIVIKSIEGFTIDLSTCVPYVYKVRYFPAEY